MDGVLGSLRRNARALRMSDKESFGEYRARLFFELRRRSNHLLGRVNPFDPRRHRLEKLVGPVGVWPQLQQYQFYLLTSLGLKPHHSLLDIGCGPITVGLRLISYLERGNYVGIDARCEPLAEAYRRIADRSLADKNPTLICSSDFGKSELGDRCFDYFWMSQLSYHLDDQLTAQLFEQTRSRMTADSVFLLDVLDSEMDVAPGEKWQGFAYHLRPLAYYAALADRFAMSMSVRGRLRDFGYPAKINLGANIVLEFRRIG